MIEIGRNTMIYRVEWLQCHLRIDLVRLCISLKEENSADD